MPLPPVNPDGTLTMPLRTLTARSQVQVGDVATISVQLPNAAAPVNADGTVNVQIVREDGDLVLDTTAATSAGSGGYSFALTPSLLADVDVLRIVWAGTWSGVDRAFATTVEVAGSVYFELAELRALPNIATGGDKYTDDALAAARRWIETTIERTCQTSFVRRYQHDRLDGDDAGRHGALQLTKTWVDSLLSVKISGTAMSATDLANVAVYRDGAIERLKASYYAGDDGTNFGSPLGPGGILPWPAGRRNIDVRYATGYAEYPPEDLRQASMKAARAWLLTQQGASGVPDRAMAITNEFGNIQLATAGLARPTGLPDVDAVILGWAENVRIPGIA